MGPPFELSQNQAAGVLDLRVDLATARADDGNSVEEIEVLRRKILED